ncbi:hypothetical protein FISHEDRAFT_78158 [Fistulina hepatica ATCC 64428]|nr:hypothetical protein FISHEDRAFT_78158 [Fistulina hepatica ATCC 64428]
MYVSGEAFTFFLNGIGRAQEARTNEKVVRGSSTCLRLDSPFHEPETSSLSEAVAQPLKLSLLLDALVSRFGLSKKTPHATWLYKSETPTLTLLKDNEARGPLSRRQVLLSYRPLAYYQKPSRARLASYVLTWLPERHTVYTVPALKPSANAPNLTALCLAAEVTTTLTEVKKLRHRGLLSQLYTRDALHLTRTFGQCCLKLWFIGYQLLLCLSVRETEALFNDVALPIPAKQATPPRKGSLKSSAVPNTVCCLGTGTLRVRGLGPDLRPLSFQICGVVIKKHSDKAVVNVGYFFALGAASNYPIMCPSHPCQQVTDEDARHLVLMQIRPPVAENVSSDLDDANDGFGVSKRGRVAPAVASVDMLGSFTAQPAPPSSSATGGYQDLDPVRYAITVLSSAADTNADAAFTTLDSNVPDKECFKDCVAFDYRLPSLPVIPSASPVKSRDPSSNLTSVPLEVELASLARWAQDRQSMRRSLMSLSTDQRWLESAQEHERLPRETVFSS